MDMGQPSNERARLDALISAAAPDPVPAAQALPLLQQSGEQDAAVLGRLAYHALTGTDPGAGDPPPPGEVVPGFPPFAAEVLMRAICGPDHRRPTAQALLIVLDTVPLASWPGADRPAVTLGEDAAEAVEAVEAVAAAEAAVEEPPATVEAPAAEPGPEVEVAAEPEAEPEDGEGVGQPAPAAIHHDEFRSLLTPSRPVPRFDPLTDPLTDPWDPDTGEIARIDLSLVTGTTATEPTSDEPASVGPEVVAEAVEPEPVPEPDAVVEDVAESVDEPAEPVEDAAEQPVTEPVAEPPVAEEPVAEEPVTDDGARGMHDEFRNFVSPSFAVPHFEPLEGTLPAGSDRVRRRRSRTSSRAAETEKPAKSPKPPKATKAPKAEKPPKPPKEPKARAEHPPVANASSDDDRRQTLLLVGVLLVLIVLGIVWVASGNNEEQGADDPQGASRSIAQPFSVAV